MARRQACFIPLLLLLAARLAACQSADDDRSAAAEPAGLDALLVRPLGEAPRSPQPRETAAREPAGDPDLVLHSRVAGRFVVLFGEDACDDDEIATARLARHVAATVAPRLAAVMPAEAPPLGSMRGAAGLASEQPAARPLFTVARAIGADQQPAAAEERAARLTAAAATALSGGAGGEPGARGAAAAAAEDDACRWRARRGVRGVVVELHHKQLERDVVQAMRGADGVRSVLQDRVAGPALARDSLVVPRGSLVVPRRRPRRPRAAAQAVGPVSPAALSAGVTSAAGATLAWAGCNTKDTSLKWLGQRCPEDATKTYYTAVVAVFKSNGTVAKLKGKAECSKLRKKTPSDPQNVQWLGGCGVAPTLARDLPVGVADDGCTEVAALTAPVAAELTLTAPVKCKAESATKLRLSGKACGAGNDLLQWASAVTPGGCTLTRDALAATPRALADALGGCGAPPALAPAGTRSRLCVAAPPPVDCEGAWGEWSPCSTPCGPGNQLSTFTILQPAANGGAACDHASGDQKAQICAGDPCPVQEGPPPLPRAPVKDGQIMPSGMPRIEASVVTDGVPHVVDLGTLPQQVVVGIVDSGIDSRHPDLNYVGGTTWITTPSPSHPGDTVEAGTDHYGHGTHVAGIVGALNNGVGTVGVAPGIGLYSLKVLDGDGRGTLSSVLAAVQWAATEGVKLGIQVINLSLAAYLDPTSEDYDATAAYICSVFKEASDAGIGVVVAAGNYGSDLHYYLPASCPGIAAVTAVDAEGSAAASYTNWLPDDDVDEHHFVLAAPGTAIFSTMSLDKDSSGYKELSGTSMAAPHVSAVAASCIMSGRCAGATGYDKMQLLFGAAKGKREAQPGYGFSGDAVGTLNGKYVGYLLWDGF
ncbi:apr [Scenedesmus sp. PABB004]|nr:apr [Scenedesmus sp. PABB004]